MSRREIETILKGVLKTSALAAVAYGLYHLSFAHIPSMKEINNPKNSMKKKRRLEYHRAVHEGLKAERNLLKIQKDRLDDFKNPWEYLRQAVWIVQTLKSIDSNKEELARQHQGIFPTHMMGN